MGITNKPQNEKNMLTINKSDALWATIFRQRELKRPITGPLHFEGDEEAFQALVKHPNTLRVAIVGTNNPSFRAKRNVYRIVKMLKAMGEEKGFKPVIVSEQGFGINMIALRAALSVGLSTVAVTRSGPEVAYLNKLEYLADIIKTTPGCGLLSSSVDWSMAYATNFINRFYTIVMMSDLLIVPESEEFDAAITSAEFAFENGIPVLAVPGRPIDRHSVGCNKLISCGRAKIFYDFDKLPTIPGITPDNP